MQQESQKATPFHVPVAVVVVLAVCAALLVMNGARPGPQPASPGQESKESDPKPSHAKPPHVGAGESSEQIDLPAGDPNALGQPDSPSHEVPLGDTQEPV